MIKTRVVGDYITSKHTQVHSETEFDYNAPHNYYITSQETGAIVQTIHLQEGPVLECGVNGIHHEDLLAIIIDRLEHFQNSAFKCPENQSAICCLLEALAHLRARTTKREQRGVDGTSKV